MMKFECWPNRVVMGELIDKDFHFLGEFVNEKGKEEFSVGGTGGESLESEVRENVTYLFLFY